MFFAIQTIFEITILKKKKAMRKYSSSLIPFAEYRFMLCCGISWLPRGVESGGCKPLPYELFIQIYMYIYNAIFGYYLQFIPQYEHTAVQKYLYSQGIFQHVAGTATTFIKENDKWEVWHKQVLCWRDREINMFVHDKTDSLKIAVFLIMWIIFPDDRHARYKQRREICAIFEASFKCWQS